MLIISLVISRASQLCNYKRICFGTCNHPTNQQCPVLPSSTTLYGHIRQLAVSASKGITKAGGSADLFQVQETLSPKILELVKAPPKVNDPIIEPKDLLNYDAFLFGVPTRYGNQPSQWRAFWDSTGGLWANASLNGKYAGLLYPPVHPAAARKSLHSIPSQHWRTTVLCMCHSGTKRPAIC